MVTTERTVPSAFNGIPLKHGGLPPAVAFLPVDEAEDENRITALRADLAEARTDRERATTAAIAARQDHLLVLSAPDSYAEHAVRRVALERQRVEGWQADAERDETAARVALNAALQARQDRQRATTMRAIATRDQARQRGREEARRADLRATGYTPLAPQRRGFFGLPMGLLARRCAQQAEAEPTAQTV